MHSPNAQPENAPDSEPDRELRFGLVLYGGVSLAVYIYGVVVEFQRLVRASQGVEESAWSAMLREAGATATVDIVSGASAGGINGVLLGKALAGGGDLRSVRSLWLDDADLGALLCDAGEKNPASLLRSDRFRQLLERGLAAMDQGDRGRPLVSAFDLFIAGTRLRPWVRRFRTDLDSVVQVLDYRKSFNLKFRRRGYNPEASDAGYDHNDFGDDRNAMLADVAQATSAFPVAFEPVRIVVDEGNRELFAADEPRSSYFSDGGILHNKPFTETISTIFTRAADRPVQRWLVSVEPDPERSVPPTPEDEQAPNVAEVASKAVLGIPRYQSIGADLDLLECHRTRAGRARRKLAEIDRVLLSRIEALRRQGGGEAVAAWSGQVLEASDYRGERRRRFRDLLAERLETGPAVGGTGPPDGEMDAALSGLEEDLELDLYELADPDFERRRVYHLLEMAGALQRESDVQVSHEEMARIRMRLWAQFDLIEGLLWSLFRPEAVWRDEATDPARYLAPLIVGLSTGLGEVRAQVEETCTELDRLGFAAGGAERPFGTVFEWFELWDVQLLTIAELSDAAARDEIRFARISPADAEFIQKPASAKLAGDALGHFGGFLKREWRQNDLLWGRLDAAEMICRMLARDGDGQEAMPERQIRAAQAEIVAEELPNLDRDYRAYMENEHSVGQETLAEVPMEERSSLVLQASEVVRNMLRGLQGASLPGPLRTVFGWIGAAIGFALLFLRWPTRAVWGRDLAVRRAVDLGIFFIGLWCLASILLIALGIVGTTNTLWTLIGIGAGIFATWSLLHAFFR